MMKMMESLLVLMVSMVGLVSVTEAGTYSGGSGSSGDPYQLATAADWQELVATSGDWSAHFILTADIDLAGVSGLTPVGTDTMPFSGMLDGGGYAISNATISQPGMNYVGLFGTVGSGGMIQVLGVNAVSVVGQDSVGGLAGYNNGAISNCYTAGTVEGNDYLGGLVGYNDFGIVEKCHADVSVTGMDYVGGLVGVNVAETVDESYAIGPVSGNGFMVGGLVGYNHAGVVTASFWDTQSSGQVSSDGGTGKTTAEMKQQSTFTAASWDFSDGDGDPADWRMVEGLQYPLLMWQPYYSGGSGDPCDPYRLATATDWQELVATSGDWSVHFVLTADIDLAGVSGLTPVGGSGTTFRGTLDGNGHAISNATINLPGIDYVGLFGNLHYGSEIVNLRVTDVDVTGEGLVGGLAGYVDGTVADCSVTGSVTADSVVGGLVGRNSIGTISGCYANCSVTGTDVIIGGLVGNNNNGAVSGCYATGSVTGGDLVGGLVGHNTFGTISSCYATGSVTGSGDDVGGLVGDNYNATVSASFWDVDTSGMTDGVGNEDPDPVGAMGKTTAEMMQRATFTAAGWDFSLFGPWRQCADGLDYPRLTWEYLGQSEWDCFTATGLYDLARLRRQWSCSDCDVSNDYCDGIDIDRSGVVDLADLAVLAEHWLENLP